jgi:hypothetical protein
MLFPHRRQKLAHLALAGLLFGLAGCSGDVVLTPVTGVVKIDGKAASGIMVQFMPDINRGGTGPTSFGTSDVSGNFTLKTYDGRPGAAVGPHLVTLSDTEEERPPQGQVFKKRPRLSSRFSIPTPGLLAVEVTTGGPPIELEASAR